MSAYCALCMKDPEDCRCHGDPDDFATEPDAHHRPTDPAPAPEVFRRVELVTVAGEHVAHVRILPVDPDVILWGGRVFMRAGSSLFREAFATVTLGPSE